MTHTPHPSELFRKFIRFWVARLPYSIILNLNCMGSKQNTKDWTFNSESWKLLTGLAASVQCLLHSGGSVVCPLCSNKCAVNWPGSSSQRKSEMEVWRSFPQDSPLCTGGFPYYIISQFINDNKKCGLILHNTSPMVETGDFLCYVIKQYQQ